LYCAYCVQIGAVVTAASNTSAAFLVQLTYFSVVGPDSTTYTEENVLEMVEQDLYRLLAKLTVSVHRNWSCVVELLL